MTQFTLAAPGDTWGISGQTFLGLYWILTAATILAVLLIKRTIRAQLPEHGSRTRLDDEPYLAAYLHGGADLALTAALASLRADGLVRCRDKRCELTEAAPARNHSDLEEAVLAVLATPRPRRSLARQFAVVSAARKLRNQLIERGLLMSDLQYTKYQTSSMLLMAVFALGVVRMLAGMGNNRPVLYLALSMAATLAIALLLALRKPNRTVPGDRELARLTVDHEHLAPRHRPDWTAGGATSAAMAVALFGAGALYAADPVFADELVAQQMSGLFGGSYSGSSWSSGGGGTSGSSAAFGYSCGGGSGGSSCGGGGSSGGGGGCGG